MRKPKKLIPSDVDLRRWCIEQAIRWPVDPYPPQHYGVASGGGGFAPRPSVDIIARAEQVLLWVTK